MTPVQPRASNGPLPLLCALGRHKTDLLVRWNDGYYFTRCRRCGLDLVRTAFSGWTAPKRYRVVWQAEPPVANEEVQSAPAHAGAPPELAAPLATDATTGATAFGGQERGQVEFPIRDAADAPPLGLSMTEQAFAARPAEDSSEDAAARDAPIDRTAAGRTAPLQGRKDGVAGLPIEDVLQNLRAGPDMEAESRPLALKDDFIEHDVAEEAVAEEDVAEDADGDDEGSAPAGPPPPASPQSVRAHYPVIPDFMDEDFPGITWDPSTGRMFPGAQSNSGQSSREAKPGWRDAIRERAHAATATGLEFIRARTTSEDRPREPLAEPPPQHPAMPLQPATPPRSFLERQGGLVAATIFGGFVLAAAIVDARSNGPARFAYRPELRAIDAQALPAADPRTPDQRTASAAARPSAGGDQAFVTASLLNCRAVPTNDGETVRKLSRGDAVQVLGADPGWVSVSHQGRQCWASSEYLSTVKPL